MSGSRQSILLIIPVVLIIVGTCGFVLVEGWNLFDGLYMTIITFSTVGYGETNELSYQGRLFASVLILVSMASVACWTATLTGWMVSGELSGSYRRRREAKMVAKMKKHSIVCGNGILSRIVVLEMAKQNLPIVYLCSSPEDVQIVRRFAPEVIVIEEDPTSEIALADSNILKCKTVVAAMQSDVDNLMIAITAKGIRPSIELCSFAQGTEYASRMTKVGADHVVSPFLLGGQFVSGLISGNSSPPNAPIPAV